MYIYQTMHASCDQTEKPYQTLCMICILLQISLFYTVNETIRNTLSSLVLGGLENASLYPVKVGKDVLANLFRGGINNMSV